MIVLLFLLTGLSISGTDTVGHSDTVGRTDTVAGIETVVRTDTVAVVPMQPVYPAVYEESVNDSLSRWELWSGYEERLGRQPGVISFGQGGLSRTTGFLIDAHENRHQLVRLDGIPVNERIFGSANHRRMPHYSRLQWVGHFSAPIRHQTEAFTRRYHVSRPLTLINYEQSAYQYRSTEGFLTRNFRPATNFSFSYWGMNEGESYRNRTSNGRNASAALYHYFNDHWLVDAGVSYSGLALGEPGGYRMADMNAFSFNRFTAVPLEPRADSSVRNTLFRISALHRPDLQSGVGTSASIYHDRYRWRHYDSRDSVWVSTATWGISAMHRHHTGPAVWQTDLLTEWTGIQVDRFETMGREAWAMMQGRSIVSLPLLDRFQIHGWIQGGLRNNASREMDWGSMVEWRANERHRLFVSIASGRPMPLPGQLYARAGRVQGNKNLENEQIVRLTTGLDRKSNDWVWGARVHASRNSNPILVGADSVFTQAATSLSSGASAWLGYDGTRLEFELSTTFHQYFSESLRLENQMLDGSGQRLWTRISAYYKNYVFRRAAYVKSGGYLLISPSVYRTSQYFPSINYWDSNSWHPEPGFTEAQGIPEFVRLDLEMSARVRSAIFLFRLENSLDNWLVPGYFETAYQPMPSMRFRFGIRWVLRN